MWFLNIFLIKFSIVNGHLFHVCMLKLEKVSFGWHWTLGTWPVYFPPTSASLRSHPDLTEDLLSKLSWWHDGKIVPLPLKYLQPACLSLWPGLRLTFWNLYSEFRRKRFRLTHARSGAQRWALSCGQGTVETWLPGAPPSHPTCGWPPMITGLGRRHFHWTWSEMGVLELHLRKINLVITADMILVVRRMIC